MKQGRGELTKRVQDEAVRLLGREITVRELRLIPYICNIMVNNRVIDQARVNDEEREILEHWRDEAWLDGTFVNPMISREMWVKFHELLWLAYVDLREE